MCGIPSCPSKPFLVAYLYPGLSHVPQPLLHLHVIMGLIPLEQKEVSTSTDLMFDFFLSPSCPVTRDNSQSLYWRWQVCQATCLKACGTEPPNHQKRSPQLCYVKEEQRLCSFSHIIVSASVGHPIPLGIIKISMYYFIF